MPFDNSQPGDAVDAQGAEDNDAARLDSLEARVDAIEQKLGLGQPDQLGQQIQQSSPFGGK